MKRANRNPLVLALIVMAGLALSSCAMFDQAVRIAPLPADLPVSASGSLFVGGRTIADSDMQVIKEFTFDKAFSPKLKAREVELMLSNDLVRLAQEAGGNAIVKLKIAVLDVQSGDMTLIWLERYLGTMSAGVGLALLVQPLFYQGTGGSSDVTVTGAILAGSGAALIGGSFLHESVGTVTYSFRVSGTVVRY